MSTEDKPAEDSDRKQSDPLRWWESKLVMTAVAAAVPLTTGLQAYFAKDKEVELARQRQQHDLEMQYVDRAIDNSKPSEQRRQMLDFLVKTMPEESRMAQWAVGLLREVADEVKSAKQEHGKEAKRVDQLEGEVKKADSELRSKNAALVEKLSVLKKDAQRKFVAGPEVEKLESERTAAETHAVELSSQLMAVQARMVRLEDGLYAPSGEQGATAPLSVRLVSLRTIEDGTWGGTRWTFDVLVNGTRATAIESDLYNDRRIGMMALHQTGEGTGTRGQPVELRIIGRRVHGGLRAEGTASVPWAQLGGSPVTIKVQVPGNAQEGCFEITASVQRAPRQRS